MATITVYVQDDGERRRRTKKRYVLALLALSAIAIGALAGRQAPPLTATVSTVKSTEAPPRIAEKIVYVGHNALQYESPIGPVTPEPPVVTPPPQEPRPVQTARTTRPPVPRAPVTQTVAPRPEQPAPRQASPIPPPAPRRLLIEPRNMHFVRGGQQRVAVFNPNETAVRVKSIRIARGTSTGFRLVGEGQCVRTLQPRERCYFIVSVSPTANGGIGIDVDHDG